METPDTPYAAAETACADKQCGRPAWLSCPEGFCLFHSPCNGRLDAAARTVWDTARRMARAGDADFRRWHFPEDPDFDPTKPQGSFIGAAFNGDASFNDAMFSRSACFDGATFSGHVRFNGATFSQDASFRGATFTSDAVFEGARFSEEAHFDDATFSGDAGFEYATFSGNALFVGATFSGDAGFRGATFSGSARFYGATFSGNALFVGATFSGYAWVRRATFCGDAWFDDATFSGDAWFDDATFSRNAGFNGATFSGDTGFNDATFSGNAEFEGATFSGDADFEGATFERTAHFDRTQFKADALFESVHFAADAGFNYSRFAPGCNVYFDTPHRQRLGLLGPKGDRSLWRAARVMAQATGRDALGFFRSTAGGDHTTAEYLLRVGARWPGLLAGPARPFLHRRGGESAYRFAKQAARERGDYTEAGRYHYAEQCAIEDRRRNESGHRPWRRAFWFWLVRLLFGRVVFGYGEKPWHPLLLGLAVIMACALVFGCVDGVVPDPKSAQTSLAWWQYGYFSVVTFTTLGYGDYQPKQGWPQVLAGLEAALGAALLATFVVCLTRKYMR